ncbi:MAG TPA: hypothetical protein V6C57_02395 [Coleofasciculaceae cyanobacterium]
MQVLPSDRDLTPCDRRVAGSSQSAPIPILCSDRVLSPVNPKGALHERRSLSKP